MSRYVERQERTGKRLVELCCFLGFASVISLGLTGPAGAVPISFGQTVRGSIASPPDVLEYTFSADANDVVCLRIDRVDGYAGPHVRLYAPDVTLFAEQ